MTITATGNGPISAFVDAMRDEFNLAFRLADFGQNTRSATSKAEAAAYVELVVGDDQSVYGVGIDRVQETLNLLHEYELGRKYGKTYTYDNVKYNLEEFKQDILEDVDFFNALKFTAW